MQIKARTIQALWLLLIRRVMKDGQEYVDEHGSKVKELLNVVWTVERPNDSEIPDNCLFKGNLMEKYEKQFLDPELKGFKYQYGHRLRTYFGVDQVDEAIKRLKSFKYTRRATMVTLDPRKDCFEDDIPCCDLIDFKLRDGKLYLTAVFRSNDLGSAVVPNFFALRYLGNYVAKEVGVQLGSVTVQSISLHVYEHDFQDMKKVIK